MITLFSPFWQVQKITKMVRKISEMIGNPTIFTNALANRRFLPYVANWDAMTEDDARYEMTRFWGALNGGSLLGNYCYMMKVGIFNEEYVDLRISWSKQGGNRCHKLGHGIHNTLHPVLVKAGFKNWGEYCLQEACAIFNINQEKLVAAGVRNFDEFARDLQLGIFDQANAEVVREGNIKGGTSTHATKVGLWNP